MMVSASLAPDHRILDFALLVAGAAGWRAVRFSGGGASVIGVVALSPAG